MKQAYKDLSEKERLRMAIDEAFFDLPDGPLRSHVLVCLRLPTPNPQEPARSWMRERYLLTKETKK